MMYMCVGGKKNQRLPDERYVQMPEMLTIPEPRVHAPQLSTFYTLGRCQTEFHNLSYPKGLKTTGWAWTRMQLG